MSRNASGRKQGRKAINEEYRPSGRVDKVSGEGQRSRLILFAKVTPKKPDVRKKTNRLAGCLWHLSQPVFIVVAYTRRGLIAGTPDITDPKGSASPTERLASWSPSSWETS